MITQNRGNYPRRCSKRISKLNIMKATGPDNVSGRVLNVCSCSTYLLAQMSYLPCGNAYKRNVGVEEVIISLLHDTYIDLDKVRCFFIILFIEYSSAFNTIRLIN